jgi:phage shock protein C
MSTLSRNNDLFRCVLDHEGAKSMFCTQCGAELREQDCYCSQCGRRLKPEAPPAARERLMRNIEHKKIAGVCAGLARYFDVDVVLVRLVFLVLAFSTGIGFVAYIIAWIVMPKDTIWLRLAPAGPDYGAAVTARNP